MTATPADVTAVVLNRDGSRYLETCLGTLVGQQTPGALRVVLVDNGSSDGSVDLVRRLFPGVQVLEAGRNLGFAAGNNLVLRQLDTPYALLLNNDTRMRPGALEALVAAAEREPRAAAVQAKLVYLDRPETVQSAGTLLLSDGSAGDRGAGEPDDGRYDRAEEVFAACGAAVLYRREALEDAGLLDEALFAYYEDTDLSWRFRLRGWTVLYEPAATVEHVHAATTGDASALMRFFADRNRLLMLLKNAPWSFVLSSYRSLGRRAAGAEGGAPGRSRRRVALSFLRLAPHALRERWRIRRRRTVADAEVLRWAVRRADWDTRC